MITEEIIKRRGKVLNTRTPFSIEIKKSIFMLMFTLLAIIVLVSIVFLLNSSQSTQKGYSIKDQQLKQDSLTEQGRQLIRQIIQAQASSTSEINTQVKSMIKPDTLTYIDNPAQPGQPVTTKKK